MLLEDIIRKKRAEKEILLMTHIVLGYPSFEANRQIVQQMVDNGVDCIEMQIPFSEPMADGPVILKANQDSLGAGTTVKECMEFGAEMAAAHDIPFLFMTYYNIVFKYGEEKFFKDCKDAGLTGLIVPDLPPAMGKTFLALGSKYDIAPILLFVPTSTEERMKELDSLANGFIYCVARRGVTGKKSSFDKEFNDYLEKCRSMTSLPIAVGFGIQDKDDVTALKGRADMAVIGSKTIRLVDEKGTDAVGPFIASLR